jgi:hypothetical protein
MALAPEIVRLPDEREALVTGSRAAGRVASWRHGFDTGSPGAPLIVPARAFGPRGGIARAIDLTGSLDCEPAHVLQFAFAAEISER